MNEKSTAQFVISGVFVFALLLPGIAFLIQHGDAYAAGNSVSQFFENFEQRTEKTLSFASEVAQSGLKQAVKQLQESRRRIFVLLKESQAYLQDTFAELRNNTVASRTQPDSKKLLSFVQTFLMQ